MSEEFQRLLQGHPSKADKERAKRISRRLSQGADTGPYGQCLLYLDYIDMMEKNGQLP